MFGFHRHVHVWEIIGKTYGRALGYWNFGSQEYQLSGTTFLLSCRGCGKVESRFLPGQEVVSDSLVLRQARDIALSDELLRRSGI